MYDSYWNLFKPSGRKEDFGLVISEGLKETGIIAFDTSALSSVVCKPCGRKLKNLSETYAYVLKKINASSPSTCADACKRKLSEVVTPNRSSPENRKLMRNKSPKSKVCLKRKSLFPLDENAKQIPEKQSSETVLLSKLNIDDLDTSKYSQIKVLIAYPSGNITVKSNFDLIVKSIIMNICLSRWSTVINALFSHSALTSELIPHLNVEVEREITCYAKSDSCFKNRSPDQLAVFSNNTLCKEIEVNCPIYSSVVRGACGYTKAEENGNGKKAANAIALASSALIRVSHPSMSAVAYRISTILFHSGISSRDLTRLNHLGVCMSQQMLISLHEKMGVNFDYKVQNWKKEIEKNRSIYQFIKEIQEKMIPKRAEDDMEIEVHLDLTEENLQGFVWYTPQVYRDTISILENERSALAELSFTEDVITQAQHRLQDIKLPTYK